MPGIGNILVVADPDESGLTEMAGQLVSAASRLGTREGGRVVAVWPAPVGEAGAVRLARLGPAVVYQMMHPLMRDHPQDVIPSGLVSLSRQVEVHLILFGATDWGTEMACRTAAKLGAGLLSDLMDTELDSRDGEVVGVYRGFGGQLLCRARFNGTAPRVMTIRPGAFSPAADTGSAGRVETYTPELDEEDSRVTKRRTLTPPDVEPDLEEAEVVVAGGRGVGGRAGFDMLKDLARLLGGAVGCTRPPVERGWMDEDRMIGMTGKAVRPRLYVGCGIYGDVYHTGGMDESERIVVINDDERAPFFEMATCGLVGDLHEIVPRTVERLRSELKP